MTPQPFGVCRWPLRSGISGFWLSLDHCASQTKQPMYCGLSGKISLIRGCQILCGWLPSPWGPGFGCGIQHSAVGRSGGSGNPGCVLTNLVSLDKLLNFCASVSLFIKLRWRECLLCCIMELYYVWQGFRAVSSTWFLTSINCCCVHSLVWVPADYVQMMDREIAFKIFRWVLGIELRPHAC